MPANQANQPLAPDSMLPFDTVAVPTIDIASTHGVRPEDGNKPGRHPYTPEESVEPIATGTMQTIRPQEGNPADAKRTTWQDERITAWWNRGKRR